jgi:hypothetical protein
MHNIEDKILKRIGKQRERGESGREKERERAAGEIESQVSQNESFGETICGGSRKSLQHPKEFK